MQNRSILNWSFFCDRKLLYIILLVVIVFVLSLTIIYASLSTSLIIDGNSEVSAASWNVYFDNILIEKTSTNMIQK